MHTQKKVRTTSHRPRVTLPNSLDIEEIGTGRSEIRNRAIAELAEICSISTCAVQKNINRLREQEKIRRVGPDKGGH